MKEDTGPVGVLTHVGIDVADLERAEAFYSALLGVKRDSAWKQYLAFEPLPQRPDSLSPACPREENQQDPGTYGPDGARRTGGAGESRSSRRKGAQGLRRARRESGRSCRPRRQRVLPIERVEAAPLTIAMPCPAPVAYMTFVLALPLERGMRPCSAGQSSSLTMSEWRPPSRLRSQTSAVRPS